MATFLDLCIRLAEESGTGYAPATVVGQTGRQKKVVNWVRDAWTKIQNARSDWRFLKSEFEKSITAGVSSYSATGWALSRFAEWAPGRLSIFDPDIGRADESPMTRLTYDHWRHRWDFGTHDRNRPTEYAYAPDETIRFGATPDQAYTVRGQYLKTAQLLAANADIPDMPERFHDAIVRRALMLMVEHDEGQVSLASAKQEYDEIRFQMERDLLPPISARAVAPIA